MAIMFPQHSFLYDFLPRIRNFIASAPPVASPHTCCHPPPPPFVMPLGLGPICKGMSKLWCLLFQQGNISNVPSLKDYRIPATCSPWPRPTQRAGVSFQRYIPSLSLPASFQETIFESVGVTLQRSQLERSRAVARRPYPERVAPPPPGCN